MTTWVALFPLFLAAAYTVYSSPEKAFLNVYIPILILLPQIFTAEITIFHNMGFAQNAAIPIFIGLLISRIVGKKSTISFSFTDLLVVAYVVLCAISEYINSSTDYVLSLLIDKTTSIILPYYMAKYIVHPRGLSILLSKRIVILVSIVIVISLYEARMSVNPFLNIGYKFFPAQGHGWPTIFRFGLARIAGPFVQTILLGMMIGVTIVLNYWLIKSGYWRKWFSFLPKLISKNIFSMGLLVFGILLTFSRGPILGTILGIFIASIGFSRSRVKAIAWRVAVLVVLGILAYEWFVYYSGINRYHAESDWQSTGAYRAELIEKYRKYVLQKPLWGWGFTTLPISEGLVSIDNQYLWLALKHGIITLGTYVAIISSTLMRLFFRGVDGTESQKADYALAFTFAGIYSLLASSFFTVYMGLQIETVFFLLTGWIEGFLLSSPDKMRKQTIFAHGKG